MSSELLPTGNRMDRLESVERYKRIIWDISVIDKLLYKVTTIVLLVAASWLLLTLNLTTGPARTIKCWSPAQFTHEWCVYGETVCLRDDAVLASAGELPTSSVPIDRFLNESFKLDPTNLFPVKETFNSDTFTYELYLMAVLSCLPFLIWRLFGGLPDGREFFKRTTAGRQNTLVFTWFLITKIGAAILCAAFVYMVTVLKVKAHHYESTTEYNWKPQDITAICRFQIRSLGDRTHTYDIQCSISQMPLPYGNAHNLSTVIASIQLWLVSLLVISVLNLATNAYLALRCQGKPYRISFIKRHMRNAEHSTCNMMDSRLQSGGILVLTLARRLGYGVQVEDSFNQCYRDLQMEEAGHKNEFMADGM